MRYLSPSRMPVGTMFLFLEQAEERAGSPTRPAAANERNTRQVMRTIQLLRARWGIGQPARQSPILLRAGRPSARARVPAAVTRRTPAHARAGASGGPRGRSPRAPCAPAPG